MVKKRILRTTACIALATLIVFSNSFGNYTVNAESTENSELVTEATEVVFESIETGTVGTENTDPTGNTESTENIENSENTENSESTENTESSESTESTGSKEPVPKTPKVKVKTPVVLKPTILSKTSMKVNWKTCSKVDGYIIYRKLKGDKKWTKIATIKDIKQFQYKDTGLKYKKTYIYAMKCYKKVDGKTYYSDFSKEYTMPLKYTTKYKNGYKYYYDAKGTRIDDISGIIGKQSSYWIKVNLTCSVVTVYAKDGKKGYTVPVKAFLCSGNIYDRTGTWRHGDEYDYRSLYFKCYSMWSSRIHNDILFHTTPYKKSKDHKSLNVKEYNKLGTAASHGCIRLQCGSSKWINDNCDSKTRITFYKSNTPGALGKPSFDKLPSWHTWDPTDPTCKSLCKKKGCHHKYVDL